MASKEKDRYKEALICAICRDTLNDPRTLPCLHTYCLKCIKQVVDEEKESGHFKCPECRQICTVPKKGVEHLKISPMTTFLLDIHRDTQGEEIKSTCTLCQDMHNKSTEASKRCLECNKKLCENCAQYHNNFFKGHSVIDLTGNDMQDFVSALRSLHERTIYCPVHPSKALEYFCQTDQTVLCQTCYIVDHSRHNCEEVVTTAKKNRAHIKAVIEQGRKLREKYENAIQDTYAYKNKLDENVSMVTSELINDMNSLIETIKREYNSYIDNINQEKDKNSKQVVAHIGNLELHKGIVDNLLTNYNNILDHGHPAEIADIGAQMKRRSELWSEDTTLDLAETIKFEFIKSQLSDKTITLAEVVLKQMAKLPNVSDINDLAVTTNGDYFITTNSETCLYNKDLNIKKTLNEMFDYVTLTKDGKLAFTDGSNCINIYHPDGTRKQIIICKDENSQLGAITTNSLNDLVVCDSNSKRVYHIDHKGNIKSKTKRGQFISPKYITCTSQDTVIVSEDREKFDAGFDCVTCINSKGDILFRFGIYGDPYLDEPRGICVNNTGNIFVVDSYNSRVLQISPQGDLVNYITELNMQLDNAITANTVGDIIVAGQDGRLIIIKYISVG